MPSLDGVLTLPLMTLPVVIPLVLLLIPQIAKLDLRMIPPLGERHNGALAAVAMIILTLSLAMVWRTGLVIHPERWMSSVGVIGTWLGSSLLARASNWRPVASAPVRP